MKQLFYYKDSRQVRYGTPAGAVEICTSGHTTRPADGPAITYDVRAVLGILQFPDCGAYLFFVTEAELVGEREYGEIYRILEVQFVSLRGPATCQDVEGIKTLIEENCFYYCFGQLDEEFVWNNTLMDTFKLWSERDSGNATKAVHDCDSHAAGSVFPGRQDENMQEEDSGTKKTSVPSIGRLDDRPYASEAEGQAPLKGMEGGRTPRISNIKISKKKKIKLKDIIDSSTHLERQLGMELFIQGTGAVDGRHSGVADAPITVKHIPASGHDFMLANMFCGYFESQTHLSDTQHHLTIQSRISNKKIGTRLLSRGVDEDGNVSFFVETSFQIVSEGRKEVFNVTRGSVPLFWSQDDPLRPQRVQIDREPSASRDAFVRHFEALKRRYGQVVVLDLLGHKKYECMLRRLYQEACREGSMPYLHFDLNQNTGDFKRLKDMLYTKLRELKEVAVRGEITFRVNCLDCLDRTNLVQFLIFSYLYPYKFSIINQMWKHNGNALSNFYTGSDALKVELATKGKISVIGRMNDLIISANRMINNKFSDQEKQRCIDILLGHTTL